MKTGILPLYHGTAHDLLIRMLEPDNLPEQYYFGTNKSAGLLKFKGRNELK
jgi:hypothetical protein